MKQIFSKLFTVIIGGFFTSLAYAASPYDIQLVSEPTIITDSNSGTIIYSVTNVTEPAIPLNGNGLSPKWLNSLPAGIEPYFGFELPPGAEMCSYPTFNLP